MNELEKYQKIKRDFVKDKHIPYYILHKIQSYSNLHPIHPIAKIYKKKLNKHSSCFGSKFFILPINRRFSKRIKEKYYVKNTSACVIRDYLNIYKADNYRNKIGETIYDIQELIIIRAIRSRVKL
jgi:hypothetical protein